MINFYNDYRKSFKNNALWYEFIDIGFEVDSFKGEIYLFFKLLGFGIEISWIYSKAKAEEWKRFLKENELEDFR